MRIPNSLLSKVKPADKARFEADYAESNFVLDVIQAAIEEEIKSLSDKEDSEEIFNAPGWEAKYAHLMGQRKMAKKLLNLFPKKR